MLTVEELLFVSVTVWLLWLPTVTLPKFSLLELRASWPLAAAPVPESENVAGELVALLMMETVALKVPAALGLKTRLTDMPCPAGIVTGRLGALNEKYWLEMDALLTVTDAVPVFDKVIVRVLLARALTAPKSKLVPIRDKVPDCACTFVDLFEVELNPWQPTRKPSPSKSSNAHAAFLICFAGLSFARLCRMVSLRNQGPHVPYEDICTGGAHQDIGAPGAFKVDCGSTCRKPQKANRPLCCSRKTFDGYYGWVRR